MGVLTVEHLTRDYGGGKGVFDLSFALEPGEVFGFLGPNGAGKTTTIRHLMGFLKAKQGRCTIEGRDCWTQHQKIQERVGYLPGEVHFFEEMTGEAYLEFLRRYRGMKGTGRAKELMERFSLDGKGSIQKMSKGMKQKVAIVAAFQHDPQILILDEPTSGLDPLMQNAFVELLLEEKKRGKTILLSSHMFEEVERTCGRVGIIRQGRLVAIDSVEQLRSARQQQFVLTFGDEPEARRFVAENPGSKWLFSNQVQVGVEKDLPGFLGRLSQYPLVGMRSVQLSLEEIFLKFYEEGKE